MYIVWYFSCCCLKDQGFLRCEHSLFLEESKCSSRGNSMRKSIDNKGKTGLVVILTRLEVFFVFFVEMITDNLKHRHASDHIKSDLAAIDHPRKYLYFARIN